MLCWLFSLHNDQNATMFTPGKVLIVALLTPPRGNILLLSVTFDKAPTTILPDPQKRLLLIAIILLLLAQNAKLLKASSLN